MATWAHTLRSWGATLYRQFPIPFSRTEVQEISVPRNLDEMETIVAEVKKAFAHMGKRHLETVASTMEASAEQMRAEYDGVHWYHVISSFILVGIPFWVRAVKKHESAEKLAQEAKIMAEEAKKMLQEWESIEEEPRNPVPRTGPLSVQEVGGGSGSSSMSPSDAATSSSVCVDDPDSTATEDDLDRDRLEACVEQMIALMAKMRRSTYLHLTEEEVQIIHLCKAQEEESFFKSHFTLTCLSEPPNQYTLYCIEKLKEIYREWRSSVRECDVLFSRGKTFSIVSFHPQFLCLLHQKIQEKIPCLHLLVNPEDRQEVGKLGILIRYAFQEEVEHSFREIVGKKVEEKIHQQGLMRAHMTALKTPEELQKEIVESIYDEVAHWFYAQVAIVHNPRAFPERNKEIFELVQPDRFAALRYSASQQEASDASTSHLRTEWTAFYCEKAPCFLPRYLVLIRPQNMVSAIPYYKKLIAVFEKILGVENPIVVELKEILNSLSISGFKSTIFEIFLDSINSSSSFTQLHVAHFACATCIRIEDGCWDKAKNYYQKLYQILSSLLDRRHDILKKLDAILKDFENIDRTNERLFVLKQASFPVYLTSLNFDGKYESPDAYSFSQLACLPIEPIEGNGTIKSYYHEVIQKFGRRLDGEVVHILEGMVERLDAISTDVVSIITQANLKITALQERVETNFFRDMEARYRITDLEMERLGYIISSDIFIRNLDGILQAYTPFFIGASEEAPGACYLEVACEGRTYNSCLPIQIDQKEEGFWVTQGFFIRILQEGEDTDEVQYGAYLRIDQRICLNTLQAEYRLQKFSSERDFNRAVVAAYREDFALADELQEMKKQFRRVLPRE